MTIVAYNIIVIVIREQYVLFAPSSTQTVCFTSWTGPRACIGKTWSFVACLLVYDAVRSSIIQLRVIRRSRYKHVLGAKER